MSTKPSPKPKSPILPPQSRDPGQAQLARRQPSCARLRSVEICAALGWVLCLGVQADELASAPPELMRYGPTLGSAVPSVDKSRFNLFNPTPRENLRDINALYNGPYTVDAGHLQIETVGVLYAYDYNSPAGTEITTKFLSLGSTTFRLGLLNNLDIGATIPPHIEVRTRDRATGASTTQSGLGDVILRSKLNLWGDDSGSTAFGLVGFIKLPTSQDHIGNHHLEGGLGLPLAVELPWDWWLGVTPEFHCFHDVNGQSYHLDFGSTFFLWHKIIGNLSGYIESSNAISAERGSPWISTLDIGLTYVWLPHLQFDLGAYIGLTRAANDITPFLGISYRF